MLLAIETSCDETAVSLFEIPPQSRKTSGLSSLLLAEVVSSQAKLHEIYGGVVPELAARQHLNNLPVVLDSALKSAGGELKQVRAIAATAGPGLKGSLLVGLSYAKGLAMALGVPLYPVNHLEGHLWVHRLLDEEVELPLLALLVSGGHTLLVRVADFREYNIVARTRDDAAGEAFDKTATLLDLPYPGGPSLSKLAQDGDPQAFSFPLGLEAEDSAFSFSGMKTSVLRQVELLKRKGEYESSRENLAASVERSIVDALLLKTERALRSDSSIKSVFITGGVAANNRLRKGCEQLAGELGVKYYASPTKWCGDNGSMIGAVALEQIVRGREQFNSWKFNGADLGPNCSLEVGVRARWPVDELQ